MSDPSAPALPQSLALQEARPESLQELFSRNPDGFNRKDVDTIVVELRAHRARMKEAREGGAKTPRVKATKGVSLTSTITDRSVQDVLGLD